MTDAATSLRPDIRLSLDTPGGIPLTLAGYLLRALGTAYPNCAVDTTGSGWGSPVMTVRIPASDLYLDDDESIDDTQIVALAADIKDDPATVAFTNGFRDGSLSVSPPPWLSELLVTTARNLADAISEQCENYLQVEIQAADGTGDSFAWIICRPGKPSPHDLRRTAEARVTVLEAQLRAASIEPVAAPADSTDGVEAS